MQNRKTFLVILLLTLGTLFALPAWAQGTITHLSGQVSVQKADGKSVPGVAGVQVNAGDTVITGVAGYVRVAMSDGGEMVLRPDSQLKVESYKFVKEAPAEDNFVFSMLKGGLRTITGQISKRGNRDAYKLNTATATVGIRGTQFDLRVCLANCGALPDGTYLAVTFGSVQASNPQGSLNLAAGQVGHLPPNQPPVILPRNPGIGFTPPPVIPKLDEKKKTTSSISTQEQGTPTTTDQPASGEPKEGAAATASQTDSGTDQSGTDTNTDTATEGECSVQ